MSLIGDVTAALETLLRATIPAIPAGALGVSYVTRLPQDLNAENLPHVAFAGEEDRPIPLRFRQFRNTLTLAVLIYRRETGHAQLVADYGLIKAAFDADPTLGGACEAGSLQLDGFHEAADDSNQVLRLRFDGVKVS